MVARPSLVLVANSSALHRRRAWAARSRAPVTGFASFDAETDRNSIIRSRRSKNDTRSWPAQPPDIMAAPTRELATVPLINLSRNCYCRFAFSLTPGPPPFSGMNSMPAVSRAVTIAFAVRRCPPRTPACASSRLMVGSETRDASARGHPGSNAEDRVQPTASGPSGQRPGSPLRPPRREDRGSARWYAHGLDVAA